MYASAAASAALAAAASVAGDPASKRPVRRTSAHCRRLQPARRAGDLQGRQREVEQRRERDLRREQIVDDVRRDRRASRARRPAAAGRCRRRRASAASGRARASGRRPARAVLERVNSASTGGRGGGEVRADEGGEIAVARRATGSRPDRRRARSARRRSGNAARSAALAAAMVAGSTGPSVAVRVGVGGGPSGGPSAPGVDGVGALTGDAGGVGGPGHALPSTR
jgi:hypothetical protein